MKMLVIGMTTFHGGMETYLMNIYRYLDKEKYKCVFVQEGTADIAYSQEIDQFGGERIDIPARKGNLLKHYLGILKLFYHNNFDIVYFNTLSLANIDYILLAKKNSVRIVHAHNPETSEGIRRLLSKIHKMILPFKADMLLCCSNVAGESMFGGGGKS